MTGAAFLFACTAAETTKKKRKKPFEPGEDWYDDEVPTEEAPIEPAFVNEDSGAFAAGGRPASTKDAGPARDAGLEGGLSIPIYCTGPLVAGDLAIVELMISSRPGAGDEGEWVEIQSTRSCWLRLKGVTVESPRGAAAPNVATVDTDLDLAPGGTFLVAGSPDPAKNNGLGGKLVSFRAADVLKNDGDTVTVKLGDTVLDTLTYPAFTNLESGRSLAFPDDCAWNDRSDWQRWSLTFAEHEPGQRGTPNETNGDVACF